MDVFLVGVVGRGSGSPGGARCDGVFGEGDVCTGELVPGKVGVGARCAVGGVDRGGFLP